MEAFFWKTLLLETTFFMHHIYRFTIEHILVFEEINFGVKTEK